jgi:hypothetical protein
LTASVATAHGTPVNNQVAIGESIIYYTKQKAWDSFRNYAESLNYEIVEIHFNYQRVD